MGNHDAGRGMGRAAELALKMRTTQTALELLDEICSPHRSCDAEFEAEDPKRRGHIHPEYVHYTDPNGPLGKLINEAFDPARDWAEEMATTDFPNNDISDFLEAWGDGPEHAFKQRYDFC